jgi:hypothetical protein
MDIWPGDEAEFEQSVYDYACNEGSMAIGEIAEELRQKHPDKTLDQIYRMLEKGVRITFEESEDADEDTSEDEIEDEVVVKVEEAKVEEDEEITELRQKYHGIALKQILCILEREFPAKTQQ